MPPAEQGAWEAVLAPRAVALLATMLASLPAAKASGGGFVDDILLAAAWTYAGWPGLVSLKDFIAAIIGAAGETSIGPIQVDARMAANALLVLGLSFLAVIISRARDQEKVISLAKSTAAEPEPVTQVKPARVAKGWVVWIKWRRKLRCLLQKRQHYVRGQKKPDAGISETGLARFSAVPRRVGPHAPFGAGEQDILHAAEISAWGHKAMLQDQIARMQRV